MSMGGTFWLAIGCLGLEHVEAYERAIWAGVCYWSFDELLAWTPRARKQAGAERSRWRACKLERVCEISRRIHRKCVMKLAMCFSRRQ